jgi:hypothetical protein
MRVDEPGQHDGAMLIHPSIQLELAHARQEDLLARAERDRLIASPAAPVGYVPPGPPASPASRLARRSLRELARRENDGVEVALLWSRGDDRLTVTVSDSRSGERFALDAAPDEALDVCEHPYAYASPTSTATGNRASSRRIVVSEH